MPDPIAAAAGFGGSPAWVLLEPFAAFGECRNHTTAYSRTSANRAIEVSFELVDPPKLSRWFVNRTGRKKRLWRGFHGRPYILNASGSLVVMRMSFYRGDGLRVFDYFVYKAGPGKPPSLDLIPGPCPTVDYPNLVGILPSGDGDGEHYSVIFPVPRFKNKDDTSRPMYEMIVFSSADQSWSTKFASISISSSSDNEDSAYLQAVAHHPSKAVAAGRGSLAWIDLRSGVLLCDGLDGGDDHPVLRLIGWPVPLPCSEATDNLLYSPSASRDATLLLSDGTIRFVKVKFQYDGVSFGSRCHGHAAAAPTGLTATVWKLKMRRRCRWEVCFEIDVAKILSHTVRKRILRKNQLSVSSSDLLLLQKVWDTKSNKLDLNKVCRALPALSLTDEAVVYLMMDLNFSNNEVLSIAVNARRKKLEAVEPISSEQLCYCSPFSFSSRLLLLDDASSSGADDDDDRAANNQSDECAERDDDVDCLVTCLLDAQDELRDIEELLELRKPRYSGTAPLCSDGSSSSSSLRDVIEAVAPLFSAANVHSNDSTPDDALDLLAECFRELGDLKSRILAPVEEMKNKVSLALAALVTLQNGKGADAEHDFKNSKLPEPE